MNLQRSKKYDDINNKLKKLEEKVDLIQNLK